MTKPETVVAAAEAQLGSPYVYGTWGQKCTPSLRKKYAGYSPSQRDKIYKTCPVLSGKQSTCAGCRFDGRLAFDCRGFTHWSLEQVGIDITGGYVGRQWTDDNWAEKGDIAAMPDLVCCVFIRKSDGSWSHTGLHVGGGRIIHCSGEVKEDTVDGSRDWSHYAIPKGLYTEEELKKAHEGRPIMRTLKKGSQGEDVRALQTMLNGIGYSCGSADGIYGDKTVAAVKRFQEDHGLKVDGIAGPDTQTRLAAAAADPDIPELPEDDDQHETPETPVALTYAKALALRDALRKALDIIEDAL